MSPKTKDILHKHPLFLIIVLNFVFLIPGLWVPYFNVDEITNAINARFINNGDLGLKDFLGNTYFFTHFLYAWVYRFFSQNTLVPIHVVHAFWQALTILAVYWAGKLLEDKKTGLWAALFYCVFSHAFMSKDFYTPSAESFSLLPAALCAGFVFRAVDRESMRDFFLAGVCAAVATYFKAPMGIIMLAIMVMLLSRGWAILERVFYVTSGFLLVLLLPACFVMPFGEGFRIMWEKLTETNAVYIQAYEGFSFLYWVLKFLIRTSLVLGISIGMTAFAVYALKPVFRFSQFKHAFWRKIFFLFFWLLSIWLTVAIGKRVFFHYYVFLLVPLALLGGNGLRRWELRRKDREDRKAPPHKFLLVALTYIRNYIVILMILPTVIFYVDACFNFSTKPHALDDVISYIKSNTETDDRIYVWGNVPQLYFYSDRLPSTVYFWSDILAGTSPGSPAMEYVRATRRDLNIRKMLIKDLQPQVFQARDVAQYRAISTLTPINESELLTVEEILDRIDHPYWQKVFADFLTKPPVLFIDSSPANIRGFGYFPIQKYELLKRFVLDNYDMETEVNGMIVYRLKKG